MQRASILVSFAVLFAVPSNALGLTLAPPGKSGADQYFETIPTSVGNAAPPGSVSGSSFPGGQSPQRLGEAGAGAAGLSRLGKDGRAAAASAKATAPVLAGAPGRTAGGAGKSTFQPAAVARILAGSDHGGFGLLLPLLLATSLLIAVGFAAPRLRRLASSAR
jgi:hypothetical protein